MKKFEPSSRSKATEDIISIGSFVEVLVLNHYVLVRKILGKLSKLQDEDAQNKTNIQEPRKLCLLNAACKKYLNLLKKGLLVRGKLRQLPSGEYRDGLQIANMDKMTVSLSV
ncbi:hypothetical protein Tco_0303603 [Tanacetum coccineum]